MKINRTVHTLWFWGLVHQMALPMMAILRSISTQVYHYIQLKCTHIPYRDTLHVIPYCMLLVYAWSVYGLKLCNSYALQGMTSCN